MDGAALKAARRRAGLTQAQLGARIGADQSAISKWERGTRGSRVPAEAVAGLARALGLTHAEIMGDAAAGAPSPPQSPAPAATPSGEPYPARAPILAMARALEIPPAAVAALAACHPPTTGVDPGEEWWTDRLLHYVDVARRLQGADLSRESTRETTPAPATLVRRR